MICDPFDGTMLVRATGATTSRGIVMEKVNFNVTNVAADGGISEMAVRFDTGEKEHEFMARWNQESGCFEPQVHERKGGTLAFRFRLDFEDHEVGDLVFISSNATPLLKYVDNVHPRLSGLDEDSNQHE